MKDLVLAWRPLSRSLSLQRVSKECKHDPACDQVARFLFHSRHDMKGLDAAQKERLKGVINDHLRESNVYGKVRSFVRDFLATEEGVALEEDKLLTALHEKKVVEELLASMGREKDRPLSQTLNRIASGASTFVPARGEKFLHVQVDRGAAFADALDDGFSLHPQSMSKGSMVAHLFLQGQRHCTRPVSLAAEPDFNDGFVFRIKVGDNLPLTSVRNMLHIVVLKQTADDRTDVIGTQSVEWRRVLLSGYLSITMELTGMGGDTAVSTGTLNLNLELMPKVMNSLTNDTALATQVRAEREQDADIDRKFFHMAKAWWKEYLQIRPEHANRMVDVSEFGVWGLRVSGVRTSGFGDRRKAPCLHVHSVGFSV